MGDQFENPVFLFALCTFILLCLFLPTLSCLCLKFCAQIICVRRFSNRNDTRPPNSRQVQTDLPPHYNNFENSQSLPGYDNFGLFNDETGGGLESKESLPTYAEVERMRIDTINNIPEKSKVTVK